MALRECPACKAEISTKAEKCPSCGEPISNEYVKKQADSLLRQWEFYENLTWRIPTMTVAINVGFFVLIGILDNQEVLDSFKPFSGILFLAIGTLTVLYGYRLYRASRLAQCIINDLRDKIDNVYGVRDIVRTTRDVKWKKWACRGSRTAMAYTFMAWGVLGIVVGIVYSFVQMAS